MPKPIRPWEIEEEPEADLPLHLDFPTGGIEIKHGSMGRDIKDLKSVTRNKVKVAKKR